MGTPISIRKCCMVSSMESSKRLERERERDRVFLWEYSDYKF